MNAKSYSVAQSRDHPNWTGRTPRSSRYDGVGGFAKDSYAIPVKAVFGTIGVLLLAAFVAYVGAAVFY